MFPSEKEKKKKHITEISAEFRPFWEPLFDHMRIPNATFGAKLGYRGKEFGEPRQECVRFFANELSGGDYYLELFNWDQENYHEGKRVLYRHKFNPDWKTSDKYVETKTDKMPAPSYTVRISDLEVVNESSVKAARPEIKFSSEESLKSSMSDDPFDEDPFTELFSEGEDDHYSKMTIRDLYCMLQNVPLSNKQWLNKLITQGETLKSK